MGTILQDLRYALRVLGGAPVVTTVVVISLALGIGANTAIFTLINAVMVKSLPVQKPEQLVLHGGIWKPEVRSQNSVSWLLASNANRIHVTS